MGELRDEGRGGGGEGAARMSDMQDGRMFCDWGKRGGF